MGEHYWSHIQTTCVEEAHEYRERTKHMYAWIDGDKAKMVIKWQRPQMTQSSKPEFLLLYHKHGIYKDMLVHLIYHIYLYL